MRLIAVYEIRDEAVIISFHGDIDLSTADWFRAHLSSGLSAAALHPELLLILDMRSVSFLGSSALRHLHRGHEEAAEAGVAVGVVSECPALIRMVELTRLDAFLALYPTIDAAVRTLSRARALIRQRGPRRPREVVADA